MTPEAGRELDALIHRQVMGLHRPPSRDYAAAKVAGRYVSVTGPQFQLTTGDRLTMPLGAALPQPEGSEDWNDRYFLHVAEFLGDRITAEVDAYEMPAPAYSTEIAAAWQVVEWFDKRGLAMDLRNYTSGDLEFEPPEAFEPKFWECEVDACRAEAPTAMLAICRAALSLAPGGREGGEGEHDRG